VRKFHRDPFAVCWVISFWQTDRQTDRP